jgi:putative membrane protein
MTSTLERDSPQARLGIVLLSLLVFATVGVLMRHMPSTAAAVGPSFLARLNALLNAAATVCLLMGFRRIKRRDEKGHERWMLAAFALSSVFLVTYVLHHLQVGSVKFAGEGLLRTLYFSILIPHIVLAAAVLPMALFTVYRGLTDRRRSHRKLARFTFPIWLYVSVSGVLVYLLLYHS